MEERRHSLENIPEEIFSKVVKYLSREEILKLSLVSSVLRERIKVCSDTLQTFTCNSKSITVEKLRWLADLDREIKGLKVGEILADEHLDESIVNLLTKHPELKTFEGCLDGAEGGFSFKALISHRGIKSLKFKDSKLTGENLNSAEDMSTNNLEELNLHGCRSLRDIGLSKILNTTTKLKTLVLIMTAITDEGLNAIFKTSPNLKTLDLGFTMITGEGLKNCREPLRKLQTLVLWSCESLTDAGLSVFLKLSPNLKYLHLVGTMISGEGLQDCREPLIKLKYLVLSGCESLTDAGLSAFLKLSPNLTILCLNRTMISGEGLQDCREPLRKLENIYLKNCRSLTDAGLSAFLKLSPNLMHLLLMGTNITGEGLKNCREPLRKLQTLNFEDCESLTDAGLSAFLKLSPNLTGLNLKLTNITGEGLLGQREQLGNLLRLELSPNLEALNLFSKS